MVGSLLKSHAPLLLPQVAAKIGPHLGKVYRFSADSLAAKRKILYRLLTVKLHGLQEDYLRMPKRKCSHNLLVLCLDFLLLLDILK